MSIAEYIKKKRIENKLSQIELADKVSVSPMTIRRWEWGQRSPRADELSRLASALNTTVAYLSGETDEPERPDHFGEVNEMIKPGPEAVKVETQTQTRDRGELYYRFPNGGEIRLPDTPENKALFKEMVTQGLGVGKGE